MSDPDYFRKAAPAAALVTQMTIGTIVGAWGGAKLDARFGTAPWLMLLCIAIGFAAGLALLVRALNRIQRTDDRDPPG